MIASALYGTVAGLLLGGWPTDRFGRRATLIAIGMLYLIGALWSALAANPYSFIAARVIGGVGIGMSTVAAPLYIAEIAPPAHRGRLAGMFQFNIVFGIVIAYASNALLAHLGADAWRWMVGADLGKNDGGRNQGRAAGADCATARRRSPLTSRLLRAPRSCTRFVSRLGQFWQV